MTAVETERLRVQEGGGKDGIKSQRRSGKGVRSTNEGPDLEEEGGIHNPLILELHRGVKTNMVIVSL